MQGSTPELITRLSKLVQWSLPAIAICAIGVLYWLHVNITRIQVTGGAVFYSGETPPKNQTTWYKSLGQQLRGLVFISATGPNSEAVKRQAERVLLTELPKDCWVGVFEKRNGSLLVTKTAEELESALADIRLANKQTSSFKAAIATLLVGMIVGVVLAPQKLTLDLLYPLGGAALMTSLFLSRCAVCTMTDEFAGLDRAAVGASAFLLTAGFVILLHDQVSRLLVTLLAVSTASYQLALFYTASDICWLCLSTLLLSSVYVGSRIGSKTEPVLQRVRWKRTTKWILGLGSVAGALVMFVAGGIASDSVSELAMIGSASSIPEEQSLVGSQIDAIRITGVDGQLVRVRRGVVLLGTDSCPPCLWAAKHILAWEDVRAFVVAYDETHLTSTGPFSALYADAAPKSIGTPTVLVVNDAGEIVDQFNGWSSDAVLSVTRYQRAMTVLGSSNE
jgi:hypothetical protein